MSHDTPASPLRVRWGEHMSVGVDALDADHEEIIRALNELVAAIDGGTPRERIDHDVSRLIALVERHFAREERAMTLCRYDGLAHHVQEHGRIRERLREIQDHRLDDPDREVQADVREFLTNWLYGHVLVDDFAYRAAFRARPGLVAEALRE